MLNQGLKILSFYIASTILYFILISLLSIGSTESNTIFRFYIAVVAGTFNSVFVIVLSITKIINLFRLSIAKQFIEMLMYIILMLTFDYLARNVSFSQTIKSYLDYPLSYIYPCVLILIFILIVRKRSVNPNQ